ncbi:hypothetical protein GGTG_00220 [Gaeumannomyces tritici R3-111a-1]|uniref:Glycosyl transferase CAP10 domain-containing protein n=1 Tax=Gaeumannomyces tritici (strain R3-111a-1) TaxID=644352 RepID=J3NG27_GAET3|nr:hypothetical protein GGTG_00220 [Gaeumannomyces tritici R3-111a-1]EJT80217.1 hypothetical protein GGTG_00220 [Gaeumannomyces tritici R3-111a-1]
MLSILTRTPASNDHVASSMGSNTKTTAQMLLRQSRSRQARQAIVSLAVGLCIYHMALWLMGRRRCTSLDSSSSTEPPLSSLSLTEQQCRDSFPGLMQSIDDVVAEGPFDVRDTGASGPLQGRIKDGKIYVVNAQRRSDLSAEMLNSRTAALHQLHRAIITSPEPIPDTVFTINFQDSPLSTGASIGYSRAADPHLRGGGGGQHDSGRRSFLMPHFSFWAWPLRHITGGTFDEAAAAIDGLEARYRGGGGDGGGWKDKVPTAVWRGTAHFQSALQPGLRRGLLKTAGHDGGGGAGWADVLPLNGTTALPIHDFCRHRYVIHTEGVAYSGRFQLLQMCRSVVLTPPLMWVQHTSHLLRPVFSRSLLGGGGGGGGGASRKGAAVAERTRRSWPVRYAASEANIVFVAPDWSDLAATVAWLEAHPEVAEGIATRQRQLFVGGGYFSPAAETCYWRALVRGWGSVARVSEDVWRGKDGVRFEIFSLKNEL